jgi:predicted lipid carrier protein YhbT
LDVPFDADQSVAHVDVAKIRSRLVEIFVLPATTLVSKFARVVPERLHADFVALAVTHFLKGQALAGRLAELSGKRFRLHLDDVSIALTFEITAAGLQSSTHDPHVTMRGACKEFVALALRREDPDTLFFQRRLMVEGETETGLHLKNLLDGWEYDVTGHLHATLPSPLARLTVKAVDSARELRAIFRRPRPGSHRSSPLEGKVQGTRQ